MNESVLKISVLSSGMVLVDGKPVEQNRLEEALRQTKAWNGAVWYYREASPNPPSQAMDLMNLIIKNKLPISLSSKPDFSDYIDANGASHPRRSTSENLQSTGFVDVEEIFAAVRKRAAGEKGPRGIVMVKPDRNSLVLPSLPQTSAPKEQVAQLEDFIPSTPKRNIAVIAYTGFSPSERQGQSFLPTTTESTTHIPFFGLLIGLSSIGHAVWIFEGDASSLTAGCRDADLLIVDSDLLPSLPRDWQGTAALAMRNENILIHDRNTYRLLLRQRAGRTSAKLKFADQNSELKT